LLAKYAYDEVAENYDQAFTSSVSKAEDRVIFQLLTEHLKQGSVVDLGCGTGALLEHLNINPKDYLGLDFSSKMLYQARAKFPNYRFREQDIREINLGSFTVDNVVALWSALSYAGADSVKEALRILKPGGAYFFMFYGKNYRKRKSYILHKFKLTVDYEDARKLLDLLPWDATVIPFNYSGDRLSWIPSTRIVTRLLRLETQLYGWSKEPYTYIAIGEKA